MNDRLKYRLNDITDAIDQIEMLLSGRTLDSLEHDRIVKAALERFLEIISEATRHIPAELKTQFHDIPRRRIQDLGDHLRHAYNNVDPGILWDIYASRDLERLGEAVSTLSKDL